MAKEVVPLYLRIANLLKVKIQNNLVKDQKLPSEREIAQILEVGRNSVRRALSELVKQGYIYQVQGRGTFVVAATKRISLNQGYQFNEQMLNCGKVPQTHNLEFTIYSGTATWCQKLKIATGQKIIKFKRLRLADTMPLLLERIYLPYLKFSKIQLSDLTNQTLEQVIEKRFHEKIFSYTEIIRVQTVSIVDARLLQIPPASSVMKVDQVMVNPQNQILADKILVARGDQFIYRLKYFHGKNQ